MPIKPTMSTQDMLQATELYLAQVEKYEEVTLKHLSEFLGVGIMTVNRWLPTPHWERLRNAWIQERLKRAMDMVCAEAKSQDDFTVERLARFAGMPLNAVHRFLPDDEWKARRGTLKITQEECERQEQPSISTQYAHRAEMYLAQVEKYEEVTLKHFAKSIGEAVHIVYTRLPSYQWEQLRNAWIEKRLKQALDTAYTQAKTQDDFMFKDIVKYAEMPYLTVRRFLSQDEWKARRATLPPSQRNAETDSRYARQAEAYLAQTEEYEAVSVSCFAEFLGVSPKTVYARLSDHQWEALREQWIKNRLRRALETAYAEATTDEDLTMEAIAMQAHLPIHLVYRYLPRDEWLARQEKLPRKRLQQLRQALDRVYAEAKTQEDFTIGKIVELTGIPKDSAVSLIGNEFRSRRATLPTIKEKVLAALQWLVDADTPVSELTRKRVVELADVNGGGTWPWFYEPLQAARRQLALHSRKQVVNPPPGVNVRVIPGGWIDIGASIWDLRPAGKQLLRKERLREDFAGIGWSSLQEELRSPEIALGTIDNHYQGFLTAAAILGDVVPDVRRATLEAVQRAWMSFNGGQGPRVKARMALTSIFEALMRLAELDHAIEGPEMLRIFAWLSDDATIGRSESGEEFLSEDEGNAVIRDCLTDIIAGIAYTDTNPDLLAVSLHPLARENAAVVVQWGTALMLLIMMFTGLRRESVLELKTDDWAEVRSGLYVLAWGHNKKVEEHVAVLPALLGQQLQLYVQRTSRVRAALETEHVFLGSDPRGLWQVLPRAQLHKRLQGFAKRHHLEREGKALTLNNTVLRRTYATRALYEGRNLAAIRAQLGHMYLASTLRYAKFDRHEHPAEVGAPLDAYGRKALTLWQAPRILNELDPGERASLLSVRVQREQDVGFCGHNRCVKAVEGSPPPCSLCEHHVTGPEFFNAWLMEYRWRKQELERLAVEPGSEMMLAQMIFQFERFSANFAFIQERFQP